MSAPRQVLEGTTYLITRRCHDRRFLLTPDTVVWGVISFCLAVAALRTGVLLHCWCFMSNHFHLVLTDPHGRLPEFMQWLNRHVANCLKIHRGWRGCFWDPSEKYSAIPLLTAEAVLREVVYVITNPVSAGLVEHAALWPGMISLPQHWLQEPQQTERPEVYFRASNDPSPKLRLTVPPQFADWEPGRFAEEISDRVEKREQEVAEKMRAEGRRFVGAEQVQAQDPFRRPSTEEPAVKTLDPKFVALRKEQLREALRQRREFLRWYHDARVRFRDGERDVEFPPGTWWMAKHAGVRCAAAG